MEQKQRLKLCPRCNAQVDRDVIICPYCDCDFTFEQSYTSNFVPEKEEHDPMSDNETIASLYPPPYQPKVYDTDLEEDPHYPEEEEEIVEKAIPQKEPFLPTILFSLGVNLAILGLLLLFFSNSGELFLRMNAKMWILFAISAIPLLIFGYRGLSKK